ncbi:Xylulose kinase [Zancudomyces culisetae]|uniref:Xylulose kinase n=1 Tax=Zancudomyces culisetae TaxID=1213189 RepID=A0A1R1PYI5_ZANCU|nr:Xylulose kinase [Zancudomyces culisetae]|eukprot:OMH86016.1 Xylulose kinase [Zancudomyces culisetae]
MLLHSNVFSQLESPTWEDSSTASECKELEDKIGVENLARITGSVAYERFTDCKICAFTGDNPASLLWFEGLSTKAQVNDKQTVVISLGTSDTLMFSLDSYPYSTEKSCDLSDSSARLGYTGHVLCHPVDPNRWAALLCYKNGSLTRDHICDRILNSIDHITQSDKWVAFEAAASSYTTTEDIFGFYYLMPEIIPKAQGIFRFRKINICSQDHLENSDSNNMNNILKLEEDQYIMEADVQDFGPLDAKLMLESQFVCMLLDCKKKGVETNHIDKIVVTGGASSNMLICQTISDVFGQNVYTSRLPNIEHSYADIDVLSKVSSYTVALGGIVSVCSQGEYQQHKDDVMSNFGLVLLSTPNPEKTQYYNSKLDSYDKLRSYLETNYPPN